jgi:hypothetical protein
MACSPIALRRTQVIATTQLSLGRETVWGPAPANFRERTHRPTCRSALSWSARLGRAISAIGVASLGAGAAAGEVVVRDGAAEGRQDPANQSAVARRFAILELAPIDKRPLLAGTPGQRGGDHRRDRQGVVGPRKSHAKVGAAVIHVWPVGPRATNPSNERLTKKATNLSNSSRLGAASAS